MPNTKDNTGGREGWWPLSLKLTSLLWDCGDEASTLGKVGMVHRVT